MYLTIHHTGISGISVYDLYIIHQTTQSILILCNGHNHKYGKTSVLQKVDATFFVDEVFNYATYTATTLSNDGTVTGKAHNIHCLHPQITRPTKSTHYVPELTQSTD